ncbi:MAG: cyclic nucleotide-binding domain-containing protein [Candidatus Rokuibacteriota bacterium]|nr:MAG: cyclic nucleotide-binding domain-containing protein [Candidatus Rokubacteria bacterium]
MSPGAAVKLTIDGRETSVAPGTTIFDAARGLGIEIPTLCHAQHQTPVGVCRVCTVEVKNNRVLAAACVRPAEDGMIVATATDGVQRARRTLVELLLSDHPSPCARQRATGDCELERLGAGYAVTTPRFGHHDASRGRDESSFFIAVDHTACILCDRCIRGCSEVKNNFVIGRTGKGHQAGIAFDTDVPMAASTCVGCGECMVSCPTGALTNRKIVDVDPPAGEEMSAEQLQKLDIFKRMSGTFLDLNRGAVVRRRFEPGEIICREGDFGSTAFYILSGKVQVSLATPMGHSSTRRGQPGGGKGFFRKLTELVLSDATPAPAAAAPRYIPIDASVDLELSNPVAELGAGDLFGEMTCLSFYPRSATVRAVEETEVLEMLRNVLQMLQKDKVFKALLDRRYRERALDTHLRTVPIFNTLSQDFVRRLRDRVELVRFEPGQVICRQGEQADSLYLIRIGFVKVSQAFPGGDMVLRYLTRPDYFGEIGLLGGEGVRTSTCTSLDHVEAVRIKAEDFHLMLREFPDIQTRLAEVAQARLEADAKQRQTVGTVQLDDFLSQGLMEAQNLLVIDLERCTRCDQCVRACAAAHDGVTRLVRDGLRYDKFLVATSCRSCRDPLCMVGCPVGSIRRHPDSLEIIIEDWCIGCGLCANQCPYGNINLHPFMVNAEDPEQPGMRKAVVREKATTCDLSRDYSEPACVYACPHDALHRIEPLKFFGIAK